MIKGHGFFPDLLITIPTILLLSLGILVIYSSDPRLAAQQAIIGLVGLLAFWFMAKIDFEFLNESVKYLYIGILLLLIIVFLLGFETRGSLRWIPIFGLQFQPSEFAKPVLILVLAKFWSTRLPSWQNVATSLLIIMPIAGLIFRQPDLGTTLTILAIWLAMLIGSNISAFKFVLMSLLGVVCAPVVWVLLKDYQKSRIASFLSPTNDPLGIGYNVIQSTIAVGSGQLFGRGLGRGTQSRLQFLPEFRTDFMFASIAEEFGFIGSLIVLFLYGALVFRSLLILAVSKSRFGSLIVSGVLGMLFFQIVINIGMNIGLLPITGITLPLLSYGGSSLISTLVSLSFVASVARYSVKPKIATGDFD